MKQSETEGYNINYHASTPTSQPNMLLSLKHGTTRTLRAVRSTRYPADILSRMTQTSYPLSLATPKRDLFIHHSSPYLSSSQSFSTSSSNENEHDSENPVFYEGPFSSLSLRLKRISVTTAIVSVGGIPLILFLQSSGEHLSLLNNVPAAGQLAVGGTAVLAATGSTAALTFCFGPYIESLEWVDEQKEEGTESRKMLKATSRNLLAMKVETIFDPFHNSSGIGIKESGHNDTDVDVMHNPSSYRPFCNFEVRGKPFFIHPELIHDEHLRHALIGYPKEDNAVDAQEDGTKTKKRKDPDDDFL